MVNSSEKGKRGEREWAEYLHDHLGIDAYRGQQRSGTAESPDVVGITGCYDEVKRQERIEIIKWMEKAVADIQDDTDLVPYVAFRKNHKPWYVCIRGEDIIKFAGCVLASVMQEAPEIDEGELAGCVGKKKYPTYSAAIYAAQNLMKYSAKRGRGAGKRAVYNCEYCGQWHTGKPS